MNNIWNYEEVCIQILAGVVFVTCIMLIKLLWISPAFQIIHELLFRDFSRHGFLDCVVQHDLPRISLENRFV